MALFVRLLALDVEAHALEVRQRSFTAPAPNEDWLAEFEALKVATRILKDCDELDVGSDENEDIKVARLQLASGEKWLRVAEAEVLDLGEYIAHVLFSLDEGGYPGSNFVMQLLRTISLADAKNRDALALGVPEYVGLYRAATEVPGGIMRLLRLTGQ